PPADHSESAISPENDPEFSPPKVVTSKGPWGPWASLGWTVVCFVVFLIAQIVVTVVVVVVKLGGNPKPDLSALGPDGILIGLATLESTPPVVGLVLLLIWVRGVPVRDSLAWKWPPARAVLLSVGGLGIVLLASDLTTYFTGHPIVPPFMESVYKT